MGDIEINQGDEYAVLTIDLGTAHANAEVDVAGRGFSVLDTNGTGTIRFDRQSAAGIPLENISTLDWPEGSFTRFFLTNDAQAGLTAIVLISTGPAFRVSPQFRGTADITDRTARELGEIHIADASELINHPRAWWVRPPCGRISYIDDFEDALNFVETDGTVTKASDAGYAHSGASAMKLVTGATAADDAGAEMYIAPLDEASLYATFGCWICLSAAADSTPRDFSMRWSARDLSFDTGRVFGFRFSHYLTTAQRKLQYFDSASGWEDVTAGAAKVRVTTPGYHYFQMAIQRVAGDAWKYAQLRMDDRTFPLTGVAGATGALEQAEQVLRLECTTDAAFATTMYVDDLAVIDQLISCP